MGFVKNVVSNTPVVRDIANVATQVLQPVEKAVVQPVSAGLASLDKAVGKAIPGGWGTVAQVAGSMMGVPTPYMVGLGALTGSGVMRPGGSFNLQGAVMGGAMAYGSSKLGEFARGAAEGATQTGGALAQSGGSGAYIIPGETGDILVNSQGQLLTNSGQVLNPATQGAISSVPASMANATPYTTPPANLGMQHEIQGLQEGFRSAGQETVGKPGFFESARQGIVEAPSKALNYVQNIPDKIVSGATSAYDSLSSLANKATSLDTYTGAVDQGMAALDRGMTNFDKTTSGIGNLLSGGSSVSKVNPMLAAGAVAYGGMGLMALEEQRKYLDQAKEANAISQAEYNQAVADINRQREYAESVVKANPFNPNPNRDVSIGETYYPRASSGSETMYPKSPRGTLYAMGGQVDDELGGDYTAQGMDQGNLQKGLFGLGYASGGMPRFLSGGGDGMSDSIRATINDKQPARLADGEFVIPADVVSHLGNGSSKAGAKQLYSMMDKVRSARTGRKAQGKQINPRQYMPA